MVFFTAEHYFNKDTGRYAEIILQWPSEDYYDSDESTAELTKLWLFMQTKGFDIDDDSCEPGFLHDPTKAQIEAANNMRSIHDDADIIWNCYE